MGNVISHTRKIAHTQWTNCKHERLMTMFETILCAVITIRCYHPFDFSIRVQRALFECYCCCCCIQITCYAIAMHFTITNYYACIHMCWLRTIYRCRHRVRDRWSQLPVFPSADSCQQFKLSHSFKYVFDLNKCRMPSMAPLAVRQFEILLHYVEIEDSVTYVEQTLNQNTNLTSEFRTFFSSAELK